MKHIRTTWAEPVYTIEITESDRNVIVKALEYAGTTPYGAIKQYLDGIEFFDKQLPATKP